MTQYCPNWHNQSTQENKETATVFYVVHTFPVLKCVIDFNDLDIKLAGFVDKQN